MSSYANYRRPTELQGGPVICGQGFGLDHGDQGGTSRATVASAMSGCPGTAYTPSPASAKAITRSTTAAYASSKLNPRW